MFSISAIENTLAVADDISIENEMDIVVEPIIEPIIANVMIPRKVAVKRQKKEVPICNVCIEPLNNSTRISVACGFCDYISCKECYKHYLMDSNLNAHCMNCKKEWDLKTMVSKFDRKFLDTAYRHHREDVLVEREKGLMPATQAIVEHQIALEKTWLQIRVLRIEENKLNVEINKLIRSTSANAPLERKKFIRKCTKDDCKGFLSSQWKCGLCETFTCPECHDLIGLDKNVEHTCDPDTLATAKLLDSDTKSCPKCAVGIFKIEGCDQMFCTECHTAFSWKTGRLMLGQIHNPHFLEFQRAGGVIPRNPLEIRCGREIDNEFIRSLDYTISRFAGLMNRNDTVEKARNILHLRHIEIPRFEGGNVAENEDLRISYMRNRITEEDFKRKIQLREKKIQKKHEFYNVLTMFITCQTELFYRLSNECAEEVKINLDITSGGRQFIRIEEAQPGINRRVRNTTPGSPCLYSNGCRDNVNEIFKEMKTLLDYTNECIHSIATTYTKSRSSTFRLGENYGFRYVHSNSPPIANV
jgi:hypothetical protein